MQHIHVHCICIYIFLVFSVLFYILYTCIHVGLGITEVAHDIQQQVSRYMSAEVHLINSYDTWHGMYVHVHVGVIGGFITPAFSFILS